MGGLATTSHSQDDKLESLGKLSNVECRIAYLVSRISGISPEIRDGEIEIESVKAMTMVDRSTFRKRPTTNTAKGAIGPACLSSIANILL